MSKNKQEREEGWGKSRIQKMRTGKKSELFICIYKEMLA